MVKGWSWARPHPMLVGCLFCLFHMLHFELFDCCFLFGPCSWAIPCWVLLGYLFCFFHMLHFELFDCCFLFEPCFVSKVFVGFLFGSMFIFIVCSLPLMILGQFLKKCSTQPYSFWYLFLFRSLSAPHCFVNIHFIKQMSGRSNWWSWWLSGSSDAGQTVFRLGSVFQPFLFHFKREPATSVALLLFLFTPLLRSTMSGGYNREIDELAELNDEAIAEAIQQEENETDRVDAVNDGEEEEAEEEVFDEDPEVNPIDTQRFFMSLIADETTPFDELLADLVSDRDGVDDTVNHDWWPDGPFESVQAEHQRGIEGEEVRGKGGARPLEEDWGPTPKQGADCWASHWDLPRDHPLWGGILWDCGQRQTHFEGLEIGSAEHPSWCLLDRSQPLQDEFLLQWSAAEWTTCPSLHAHPWQGLFEHP